MLQAFFAKSDDASRGNWNSGIRRRNFNCQPLFYKPQLEALEDRNLLNAGSLDPTFGVGGLVIPAFDMARDAYQEALQSDGKIVVAGSFTPDPPTPAWLFTVARYNPDGSPDTSFGQGGFSYVRDFIGQAFGVAIQNDGKIVVAGETDHGLNPVTGFYQVTFAVARFNSDGSLDSTFGNGGEVITDFGRDLNLGHRVIIQPDGKIVVSGVSADDPPYSGYAGYGWAYSLVRYNSNGSLDSTFGSGGVVLSHFPNVDDNLSIQNLALDADGRILLIGSGVGPISTDFLVVRYNQDGSLDDSFGASGKVLIDFSGNIDSPVDLAVQPNGKILVVGNSLYPGIFVFVPETPPPGWIPQGGPYGYGYFTVPPKNNLVMARLNPDGTLDDSFGIGGEVVTSIHDKALGIALQPDGKIIVASSDENTLLTVSRYTVDGMPDASFGTGGVTTTDISSNSDPWFNYDFHFGSGGVFIQPDSSIVVLANENGFLYGPYLSSNPPRPYSHQTFVLARYLGGENHIPEPSGDHSGPNDGSPATNPGIPVEPQAHPPAPTSLPPLGPIPIAHPPVPTPLPATGSIPVSHPPAIVPPLGPPTSGGPSGPVTKSLPTAVRTSLQRNEVSHVTTFMPPPTPTQPVLPQVASEALSPTRGVAVDSQPANTYGSKLAADAQSSTGATGLGNSPEVPWEPVDAAPDTLWESAFWLRNLW
jgi:uncharacterized delta-60 repeat protein